MSTQNIYGWSRSEFPSDREYGKRGEAFFEKYKSLLLRAPILPFAGEKIDGFVEGGDFRFIQVGKTYLRYSFLEVKTFGNMSILRYGNDCGITIPFELFSCESGKGIPRGMWDPWGWLRQITHPREYNEKRQKEGSELSAVMPGTLVYLFCESAQKDEVHPFVCVAIENVSSTSRTSVKDNGMNDLIDDLKIHAGNVLGLDLEKWDVPKATDSYWSKREIRDHVHENIWNVPLDIIAKHGGLTVTLIDQMPDEGIIKQRSPQYARKMIERLHYLHDIARYKIDTIRENEIMSKKPGKVYPALITLPEWFQASDELQNKIEEDLKFLGI